MISFNRFRCIQNLLSEFDFFVSILFSPYYFCIDTSNFWLKLYSCLLFSYWSVGKKSIRYIDDGKSLFRSTNFLMDRIYMPLADSFPEMKEYSGN